MKRVLTTTVALFLMISAFSQWGVTAGITQSRFYFGYDQDIKVKYGFIGGVYNDIKLSKSISLQPELLYHNKGTLINYDPSYDRSRPRDQWKMNLMYITLPVTLKLHLGNFSMGAGGYVARLVHFNNNKWNYDEPAMTYDVKTIKTIDYGYVVNISYDCYGAIFQLSGTLGQPIIGRDGGVFSRVDVTPTYRHIYKNATVDFLVKIPFTLK